MSAPVTASLLGSAQAIQDWIIARRRHLHQNPELSFCEEQTSAYVEQELRSLGFTTIHARLNGNFSLCAELLGRDLNRCIALRADMDALPIEEQHPCDFRSTAPGVSHMCGHDAHTAMLLGAARLLKEREADLPCTVRLFFQGGEEKAPGGARDFIESGMLEGVDAIYGLHVDPRHDTGTIHFIEGPAMAGVDEFTISIIGKGGHAAFPHENHDPVLAAANVIMALQQIVSRTVDPFDPTVVSVTSIHGGEACNVTPPEVILKGTYRSFHVDLHDHFGGLVSNIAHNVAEGFGCMAETTIIQGYPPLHNHPTALHRMREAAREFFPDGIADGKPMMGSEDFAFYTHVVPGCFAFLGVAHPADEDRYMLHHPKFHLDEDALFRGTAILAKMALNG